MSLLFIPTSYLLNQINWTYHVFQEKVELHKNMRDYGNIRIRFKIVNCVIFDKMSNIYKITLSKIFTK